MKKFIKYSLLALGWLFAGIILLAVVAGLLIQTRPVKKKITTIAEKKVSQVLTGDVSIGEIDGNFFTNLSLKNVLWMNENDTLAFVKQLDMNYELRPLLNGKLLIHNALILNPYFYLKQNKDSTWNVQNLVEQTGDEENPKSSSGSFSIKISNFKMQEGEVKISAVDTLIPREINHLNTQLALAYSSEKQSLNLDNLSLSTKKPDFTLEKLALKVERNTENIQLQDLVLKTSQNKLEGQANYKEDTLLNAAAEIESDPLHLNEFEFFIPGFKLPASPTLKVKTDIKNGGLNASIILADGNQNINLEIQSENFAQFLNNSTQTRLKYDINGDLQDIDLAHWLGDPNFDYTVNGQFQVQGDGTNPKTASIKLKGDFKDCIIKAKPVDKLLVSLNLENGDLDGNVNGEGDFGIVNITPEINDLQGTPSYNLKLITKQFNLAEITGNDSLQSDINLTANIKGKNFDPKKLTASANLQLSKSQFREIVVDTLESEVKYRDQNVQIDSLWAKTQTLSLNASGNYNLEGNSDLSLKAKFSGLEEFAPFIPVDEIFAEGKLEARVQGKQDSLNVNTQLNLKNVRYSNLTAEEISVDANGQLTSTDTIVKAQILAGNFSTGKFLLDSVNFAINYAPDSLFVDGKVSGENINTNLAAAINLGKSQQITVKNWAVDYKNQHFDLQNPPAIFELDSTQYKISNFKLVSDNSDSAQFVMADGIISRIGDEDLQLEIANINIQQLLEMFDVKFGASGVLDVNAEVKGTAKSPLVTGKFAIDNAILNEYEFSDFSGNIGFQNNKLNADLNINPKEGGKFNLTGTFPMLAELDSMKFKFDPKDSLSANIDVEQFPLAIIQNINIAKDIKGYLEGNVDVSGTLESPDPKGNFRMVNASLEVPEYGINYNDITLNIDFLPDAIRLDSFYIKSKDGTMKASGTVDFNAAFYKGDVNQSKINVEFHNFNPVDHRQFNMQLSGNATLQGKKGDVVFSGDLNIPESQFYLPAIFNMLGKRSAPEIPDPILIREMKSMNLYKDSLSYTVDTINTSSFNFSYLDNFTGSLHINIPKNTWIKNEDMYIEISGDLELRKNKDFFELFGSVDVVRGQYDLLGKTFIIDDGTISFRGGEEMEPHIDITASYTFRNTDKVEKKLTVRVSGTAKEPSVNFSMDGSKVSEGDALSYILFGKSMDELSIDQQQNVAGSGNIAGTAAAALLSSQLTNVLGKKLNVDYIEIKGGSDFQNATVVVGKYITNDLFVSYEQRFGETNQKDMAKYEVKLEYELFKFLFLQLNNSSTDSGFDVIFKLSSE